jgi:hypothetical protein
LERIIVIMVFTIYQLAHFLMIDLEKDIITKKYKFKLLVITDDFFLSYPHISKEDRECGLDLYFWEHFSHYLMNTIFHYQYLSSSPSQ